MTLSLPGRIFDRFFRSGSAFSEAKGSPVMDKCADHLDLEFSRLISEDDSPQRPIYPVANSAAGTLNPRAGTV